MVSHGKCNWGPVELASRQLISTCASTWAEARVAQFADKQLYRFIDRAKQALVGLARFTLCYNILPWYLCHSDLGGGSWHGKFCMFELIDADVQEVYIGARLEYEYECISLVPMRLRKVKRFQYYRPFSLDSP